MEVFDKKQFNYFLDSLILFGFGSQGSCYLDPKTNLVYKVFYDWEDDFNSIDKKSILHFENIHNTTFIFPSDLILFENKVIGYISKYVKAINLYKINPLRLDLKQFISKINGALKDISILSMSGVYIYDMMYNIMLGKKIYVIDTMEYTLRESTSELFQENVSAFNLEIMYFLVDNYFDKVVNSNPLLKEMYASHGKDISITEFITIFQKYLSELMGQDVKKLITAQSLVERLAEPKYARTLTLSK